ncbi:hypothetical protein Nepgr_027446 [Nepenthes gracilis]|uniref:Protein Jade-1 n=1 Tax=Nepenthes gracilis TaxID=150966 RepID=A0AAD3Y1G6_NEPGR|nr:hypothetical protein Nepgr_027446 [Nepenthes gracilis]
MDTGLQKTLPPSKRFRLLKQGSQRPTSTLLPAKKRKETPEVPLFSKSAAESAPSADYWLPAKKRVWAPEPHFSPVKPASYFDLNVEYNPSAEEEVERETKATEQMPVSSVADSGEICEEKVRSEGENNGTDQDEEDDGIACAICESTDGDPSDPIVFCDGCNLMVHTICYGNPLTNGVPEGDWLCAQCLLVSQSSHEKAQNCCLCPVAGGALKQTNDGRWAHVVCAVLVPEVFFEDPEGREGINCCKVPKRRWKEVCFVCGSRNGCAIDCSEPNCPLAFHVTCGLKEGLCIDYSEGKKKGSIVAAFCREHTELWKKVASNLDFIRLH